VLNKRETLHSGIYNTHNRCAPTATHLPIPYHILALLQHLYVINALNGLHAFLLACNVGTIVQTNCSNIKAFDLFV